MEGVLKRGRPPGKKRKSNGWAPYKPTTTKRKQQHSIWEVASSLRLDEIAPVTLNDPAFESNDNDNEIKADIFKFCTEEVVRKAWRAASIVSGEGPPGEPLYGEINQSGVAKILTCLSELCGLGSESVLLDIGCGTGKVLLHAVLAPGVRAARGVEITEYRAKAAYQALGLVRKKVSDIDPSVLSRIQVTHQCVESTNKWHDATHIYMYDLGFPESCYVDLLRLWCKSRSARYIVSYRKPHWLWKHGFDLILIRKLKVKQQGKGAGSHTAYVYGRPGCTEEENRQSNRQRNETEEGDEVENEQEDEENEEDKNKNHNESDKNLNFDGYKIFQGWLPIQDELVEKLKECTMIPFTETIFNNAEAADPENDKRRKQTFFEDFIASDKEISNLYDSINRSLQVLMPGRKPHDMVILRSEPGCVAQRAHTDYTPYDLGGVSDDEMPLGCLIALMDETYFDVWPRAIRCFEGCDGKTFECVRLKLNAGDMLIFRGDLVHAGAAFAKLNIRIHVFLDVESVLREHNTTFFMDCRKYILSRPNLS